MAAFSPKNFLNLFAKFYRSPTFPQIFVFVFFGLRGRIQVYSFRNTIWNSEIFWNILKNRKLPTDFYLVAIWQLNPVKGYKDFLCFYLCCLLQIVFVFLIYLVFFCTLQFFCYYSQVYLLLKDLQMRLQNHVVFLMGSGIKLINQYQVFLISLLFFISFCSNLSISSTDIIIGLKNNSSISF